jgi:hypothetical protein
MANEIWYYHHAGTRHGPVHRHEDLVWCQGMPSWVEAYSVPGLFDQPDTPILSDSDEDDEQLDFYGTDATTIFVEHAPATSGEAQDDIQSAPAERDWDEGSGADLPPFDEPMVDESSDRELEPFGEPTVEEGSDRELKPFDEPVEEIEEDPGSELVAFNEPNDEDEEDFGSKLVSFAEPIDEDEEGDDSELTPTDVSVPDTDQSEGEILVGLEQAEAFGEPEEAEVHDEPEERGHGDEWAERGVTEELRFRPETTPADPEPADEVPVESVPAPRHEVAVIADVHEPTGKEPPVDKLEVVANDSEDEIGQPQLLATPDLARVSGLPAIVSAHEAWRPSPVSSKLGGESAVVARDYREPLLRLVDALLDSVARALPARRLDAIDRFATRVAGVAYLTASGLALILFAGAGAMTSQTALIVTAAAGVPVAVLLYYLAATFLSAGASLIARSPSPLSCQAFPRCLALVTLVASLATMILGAMVALQTGLVIAGVVAAGVVAMLVYASASALSLDTLRVQLSDTAGAGDEAVGILSLVLKLFLVRTIPVTFLVAASVGVACSLMLFADLLGGGAAKVALLTWACAGVLAVALVPFATYLMFVLVSLGLDLARAVLVLPDRLDRLAARKEDVEAGDQTTTPDGDAAV